MMLKKLPLTMMVHPTNDYVDAEIIEEMATPQPTPAITQNVQNQFNINQSGNELISVMLKKWNP
jgi:hypothetical protein